MLDVIVAGGGPAGALAALTLARGGARVLVVDRCSFPRDKLCGDTLNPGAVEWLASRGLTGGPLPSARKLEGMRVTGPGASVEGRYRDPHFGLCLRRRDLDAWLLAEAQAAGARVETGWQVVSALTDGPRARGVILRRPGAAPGDAVTRIPAAIVIGADGRRSVLARAMGVALEPPRVRRWAFGTYAEGVHGMSSVGEMHIRPWGYCGLAPMPDGTTNVCVVTGARPVGRTPLDVMRHLLQGDAALAGRVADARFEWPVRVLGPLAADVRLPGGDGVLLAGDAAGFVDPMTGDGLRLALLGGALAAEEAARVLEHGDYAAAPLRLAAARRRAFGAKLRFNRLLRAMAAHPAALRAAGWGASLAPQAVARAVQYAGDVP